MKTLYKTWGSDTKRLFPDADSKDHLIKLQEEVLEAIQDPSDVHEYADMLLALFGAAYKAGITYDQLHLAAIAKANANRESNWVKMQNGIYKRVKQTDDNLPYPVKTFNEAAENVNPYDVVAVRMAFKNHKNR